MLCLYHLVLAEHSHSLCRAQNNGHAVLYRMKGVCLVWSVLLQAKEPASLIQHTLEHCYICDVVTSRYIAAGHRDGIRDILYIILLQFMNIAIAYNVYSIQCILLQATEPASLIPLLCNCEAAVLVGDPCQLPPTIISTRVSLNPSRPRCKLLPPSFALTNPPPPPFPSLYPHQCT